MADPYAQLSGPQLELYSELAAVASSAVAAAALTSA